MVMRTRCGAIPHVVRVMLLVVLCLGGALGAHAADGDGLEDTLETQLGTNPSVADSDRDGLSDGEEVGWDGVDRDYVPGADTNPLNPDTDGDGVADGREAEFDHDPLDPADVPILPLLAWPAGAALLFAGILRIRLLARSWCVK